MCLILLAWQVHPDYPLVVAANRDEFYARPSQPAAFWPDFPDILAGRDCQAGGTWLGVSRSARFAALTNYREHSERILAAPSRGALVADFLAADHTAPDYCEALTKRGADYNGFSLFVSDGRTLAYCSNRSAGWRRLAPGIYGLSNHLLDTQWPKLAAAKSAFADALERLPDGEPFFELLADREIVADIDLPKTGVALEWERILSAIFVASPDYGTRASSLLTMGSDAVVNLTERSFGPAGAPLGEVSERFASPFSRR